MAIEARAAALPAEPSQREATSAAVDLRGVTRLFGALPGLLRVTLHVDRGEVVWLRGPNGSGKSTLLRVVGTALSATLGEGRVLGHDLRTGRAAIRARTELLGHNARLYEDLTAAENLGFACALFGCDPRGIMPALADVGLDEVAHLRTAGFSQGMRQRLALARCRLRDPDLLLLDEPYAGLDADARFVVDDVLERARRRGRTVLLASHEAPSPHLVDRDVLLEAGRVVLAAEG
jgi:ABC-type multidrug transport system ATPase subunit